MDFVSLYIAAEAVNMNAGFGFSGYDDNGRAKWDLLDNAKIRKIEVRRGSWHTLCLLYVTFLRLKNN